MSNHFSVFENFQVQLAVFEKSLDFTRLKSVALNLFSKQPNELLALNSRFGFYMIQRPGADVKIFKDIFAEKFIKKLAFLTRNKGKLCKILIITLVFEKNANFFAENWRKSQKIVYHNIDPSS
jgi:hypothetical protein